MVPIKEMSDVLRVVKDIPTLKTGTFVRLKRTIFKDDLAQVHILFFLSIYYFLCIFLGGLGRFGSEYGSSEIGAQNRLYSLAWGSERNCVFQKPIKYIHIFQNFQILNPLGFCFTI